MLFITGNKFKAEEASAILEFKVKNLQPPELQSDSLEEIAEHSALWAFEKTGEALFVDDSGLFVKALQGFPGPYSSFVFRTLGWQGLLKLMEGINERQAHFKSVVAYVDASGKAQSFTGRCDGIITTEGRGSAGFGFDPVFVPAGTEKTFSEDPVYKAQVDHRVTALRQLKAFLE